MTTQMVIRQIYLEIGAIIDVPEGATIIGAQPGRHHATDTYVYLAMPAETPWIDPEYRYPPR